MFKLLICPPLFLALSFSFLFSFSANSKTFINKQSLNKDFDQLVKEIKSSPRHKQFKLISSFHKKLEIIENKINHNNYNEHQNVLIELISLGRLLKKLSVPFKVEKCFDVKKEIIYFFSPKNPIPLESDYPQQIIKIFRVFNILCP